MTEQPDDVIGSLSDFSRALLKIRLREVETRIAKLVGAGVPANRLTVVNDLTCECLGTGIVLRTTETSIFGATCPDCLGVAMVIDKRTKVC